MSVRACQLCGKPLGRIRKGGDENFCSREHRNQFRLRQGMDTLEEANKVASLMRRRESPKQIPAEQLLASEEPELRGRLHPAAYPARSVEASFSPFKPVLFSVRVVDIPERFRRPVSGLSRQSVSGLKRKITPVSLPRAARGNSSPVLNSLKMNRPSTGVVRAGLTSILRNAPATRGSRREYGAVLRFSRRPAVPDGRFEMETPGGAAHEKTRRLQPLSAVPAAAAAAKPHAYPGLNFEKRALAMRPHRTRPNSRGKLPPPRLQEDSQLEVLDILAKPRAGWIPQREGVLQFPHLEVEPSVAGAQQRGSLRLQPAAYEIVTPEPPRLRVVTWEAEASVTGPSCRDFGLSGGTFSRSKALPWREARNVAGKQRPSQIRFAPGEFLFDRAPLSLQGSMGLTDEPARPVVEPIEEHFNAGLDHWTGKTSDWRLDAAGARPAGLALLRSTVDLADYEFEFFTRIEVRAVTFVFRASNTSNYHKVTIAMVESGRYELQHCAVIGGVEDKAAVAPIPGVLRPGAAFTVKARVLRNDFTIWLDGEMATQWTDGRLAAGGIGFMAPRDDRARVYWVRLSPVDGLNSQAAPHRSARSIQ